MVTGMDAALRALGVRDDTLSDDERAFLDSEGYLYLPAIMTQEQVTSFVARLEELLEIEGEHAGIEVHQEEGARRLGDLINKDPMFDFCYTHPRLLAAVQHILSTDFKVHSLNSRFALPGEGNQELHMDWGPRDDDDWEKLRSGRCFLVANSLWLLDDFTDENGPTRLVPGSHRSGKHPTDEMEDRHQPHPDEVCVNAKAGTVVVFNGHTWHGGSPNRSQQPRRAMHMAFIRRHLPQQTNQKEYLRPETAARLSAEQRLLLDV